MINDSLIDIQSGVLCSKSREMISTIILYCKKLYSMYANSFSLLHVFELICQFDEFPM